ASSTQSPPSPITHSEHCVEAIAPQTARSQKRKLETEDGPRHKWQRVEPPSALKAVAPEFSRTPPQTQDNEGHGPPTEGIARDDASQALGITQENSRSNNQSNNHSNTHSIRQDNQQHEREDRPLSKSPQCSTAPLSKANLKLLQQEIAASEEMDNDGTSSSQARKRRAPLRQASNSELVSGTYTSGRSKEPTPSHNFYRYIILERARIQIVPRPPPQTVQVRLDVIFNRRMTDERIREIKNLAKDQSENFGDGIGEALREDDSVELAHQTIFMMHKDRALVHRRKTGGQFAGPLESSRADIPGRLEYRVEAFNKAVYTELDIADSPNKQQEADRPFPTPDNSHATMPPPAAPATAGQIQPVQPVHDGAVKTPRPDFTCGLRHSVIVEALADLGLDQTVSNDFLRVLQLNKRLCSNPTQHFIAIRFPFLVIEGKAYTTGKTLFEAENQAAVSGSSMLNLQQQLASLYDSVKPASKKRGPPLAFSVCTQGPIWELWVHHLNMTKNITTYHMNIIATCHASLADELERFLLKMDCLITWYKHDYLKEVVDQLFAIASHDAY
ncbi:MAG: hypothetical protein Q9182_003585, partial [Xanthomendoza sp. 2 TL-2023]